MNLVTNFGAVIQSVGASWMMASIASTEMVALVQSSVTLPIMLLSLAAGALADIGNRRIIMLVAQSFMLVVSATLAIVAFAGQLTPWSLLLLTFLVGCGIAFNGPAWQASVGDIVPRRDLTGAVTLNSMGYNLARSVGPAIGGLIVATAGAAAAFAVNAVSYVGLIVVLLRWKPERAAQTLPRERLGGAILAGIRYTVMSPRVYAVLLRGLVFGFGACAAPALMPLVARETIGGGPLTFGLLLGAFGIGAVAGGMASNRLRERYSAETIVRGGCVSFAAAAATTGLSPWLALTAPVLMIAGAGFVLVLSTFNVTVQMSVPRWVVARALALYQMATFGGMAGGSWVWGMVAEDRGLALALGGSGVVLVVCALMGLRIPLPPSADLNLDLLSRWKEPDTAVPILPRSGPIVITIEYVIREEDIPEFLRAMSDRRRIRRRDGARHWSLLRDLGDPTLWIERYHTPTWLDYVRHNQRITQADLAITDRVRALHRGPGQPRVRRMIDREPTHTPIDGREPREISEALTDPTGTS